MYSVGISREINALSNLRDYSGNSIFYYSDSRYYVIECNQNYGITYHDELYYLISARVLRSHKFH